MSVPVHLTTNAQNEIFGGVTYDIEGKVVPALQLKSSNTGVYFEPHILTWKDPTGQFAPHPMKGAFRWMLAEMSFQLTGANRVGKKHVANDGWPSGRWRMAAGVFKMIVSVRRICCNNELSGFSS